jgi:hypothetical protein
VGIYSSDCCGGHLVNSTCLSCGCGHGDPGADPLASPAFRYVAQRRRTLPARAEVKAEELRERDRQEAKRRHMWATEE